MNKMTEYMMDSGHYDVKMSLSFHADDYDIVIVDYIVDNYIGNIRECLDSNGSESHILFGETDRKHLMVRYDIFERSYELSDGGVYSFNNGSVILYGIADEENNVFIVERIISAVFDGKTII